MDEDDILGQVQQPEGKIGAKKMRKLQEKAERKAAREVGCSKEPGDTLTELSWLFVLAGCVPLTLTAFSFSCCRVFPASFMSAVTSYTVPHFFPN